MIEGIGSWVRLHPSVFLTDQYLKYIAWALSDKARRGALRKGPGALVYKCAATRVDREPDAWVARGWQAGNQNDEPLKDTTDGFHGCLTAQDARVRLASVNALLALYSNPDNLASLSDFTQRFQQRFSELFYDVDEAVAVKGVRPAEGLGPTGAGSGAVGPPAACLTLVPSTALLPGPVPGCERPILKEQACLLLARPPAGGAQHAPCEAEAGAALAVRTGEWWAAHAALLRWPPWPAFLVSLVGAVRRLVLRLSALPVACLSRHPNPRAALPQVYELLADESHAVRHAVAELVAAMLEEQGTALLAQVSCVRWGWEEEGAVGGSAKMFHWRMADQDVKHTGGGRRRKAELDILAVVCCQRDHPDIHIVPCPCCRRLPAVARSRRAAGSRRRGARAPAAARPQSASWRASCRCPAAAGMLLRCLRELGLCSGELRPVVRCICPASCCRFQAGIRLSGAVAACC